MQDMLRNAFFLDEQNTVPNIPRLHPINLEQIGRQPFYLEYQYPEEWWYNKILVVHQIDQTPSEGIFLSIERSQSGCEGFEEIRHLMILTDGRTIEFPKSGWVPFLIGMTHNLLYALLNPESNKHIDLWCQTHYSLDVGDILDTTEQEQYARSIGMRPISQPSLLPHSEVLARYNREIIIWNFRYPK